MESQAVFQAKTQAKNVPIELTIWHPERDRGPLPRREVQHRPALRRRADGVQGFLGPRGLPEPLWVKAVRAGAYGRPEGRPEAARARAEARTVGAGMHIAQSKRQGCAVTALQ